MGITESLIQWYERNKRDLPWRNTHDPYKIWLSEIILQQTRVDQGLNYYTRFVERYAKVNDLAAVNEEEVLKLWQGLGYYSRARNLHHTAKIVATKFNCVFPDTYNELLQLKGVGPYTAAAISSICFGEPRPVVDGNVLRVISRLFAITDPVNETAGKTRIEEVLTTLIDKSNPGTFNQAVMEFGALFCKPKNPSCKSCPLQANCQAWSIGLVSKLPHKSNQVKQKKRYFNYFLINFYREDQRLIYFHKRKAKDIWQGLYDFPLIESAKLFSAKDVLQTESWKNLFMETLPVISSSSRSYIHQLTHRQINARFFVIDVEREIILEDNDFILVDENDIQKLPLPRLIDKYLKDVGILR